MPSTRSTGRSFWTLCVHAIQLFTHGFTTVTRLNHDTIIYATTGVEQGDLLGPVLFALVLHPLIQFLRDTHSLRVGAIFDDVTFLGSTCSTLQALEFLRSEGPLCGLRLSPKTCVWSPSGAPLHAYFHSFSLSTTGFVPVSLVQATGVSLLGSAVSLDPNF